MRFAVETKFRLHNSPQKKIALRCCLTGETLVKLVLISSSGLNSMLSSPDVHKMIFWTTDHILAVVTEIKQSMNYFNGERKAGCERLFMRGSRIWSSLFDVQPSRIISTTLNCCPREKTPGTEGTKSDEWNQRAREKRWRISLPFLVPLFEPVRGKPHRNCDLLARVFPALFAGCM